MASYKVDKSKLLKVGLEAFEMLEQACPSPRQQKSKNRAVTSSSSTSATAKSCVYKYQPPQTLVFQVPTEEMMISSYEATKFDYNKRKSAAVAY